MRPEQEVADARPRPPWQEEHIELTGLFVVSRDEATQRVIEFDCVMARPSARKAADGRAKSGP